MSQKLVDPVHFFDVHGASLLSNAHLQSRNRELEAEVVRLRKLIVRQQRQLQDAQPKPTEPVILN